MAWVAGLGAAFLVHPPAELVLVRRLPVAVAKAAAAQAAGPDRPGERGEGLGWEVPCTAIAPASSKLS